MQNNRFCNILTVRMLSNIDILMKNVHTSILLFSAYEARNGRVGEEFSLFGNGYFFAKFPLLYMNASTTLPEAVKRVCIIGSSKNFHVSIPVQ
jgi:hypothetical protein